jgi:hypothetical protein
MWVIMKHLLRLLQLRTHWSSAEVGASQGSSDHRVVNIILIGEVDRVPGEEHLRRHHAQGWMALHCVMADRPLGIPIPLLVVGLSQGR